MAAWAARANWLHNGNVRLTVQSNTYEGLWMPGVITWRWDPHGTGRRFCPVPFRSLLEEWVDSRPISSRSIAWDYGTQSGPEGSHGSLTLIKYNLSQDPPVASKYIHTVHPPIVPWLCLYFGNCRLRKKNCTCWLELSRCLHETEKKKVDKEHERRRTCHLCCKIRGWQRYWWRDVTKFPH